MTNDQVGSEDVGDGGGMNLRLIGTWWMSELPTSSTSVGTLSRSTHGQARERGAAVVVLGSGWSPPRSPASRHQ